jgi:hypothetical protein
MLNNAQKTPFATSLERFSRQRALDAYNLTGKGLPCSVVSVTGSIVTVKFELSSAPFTLPNITVPILGPEYVRYPTQVGDKGVVVPFDALLGPISGMGGNTANLAVPPSNLGALAFVAIANMAWTAPDDPNAFIAYGPNGFILRDVGKNCTITGDTEQITVSALTTLTLQVGAVSIVISATGITFNGPVHATGNLQVDGNLTNNGTAGLGGGAKKVVLDGDSVSGGVVHASSTKTTAT